MAEEEWDLPEQRAAVLDFIASSRGLALARKAVGPRLSSQADDVRQEAWLAANTTFANRDDAHPEIHTPEQVARYAAVIIRRQAVDMFRAAHPERHLGPVDDVPEIRFVTGPERDVELVVLEQIGSDDLRRGVWRRYLLHQVPCNDATLVVAVSLIVISILFDPGGRLSSPEGEATGGTDIFDRAVYTALACIRPSRFVRGESGYTPADRQAKARVARCVKLLLGDVVEAWRREGA